MGISQYIRDIGRGKEGARSLDVDQAYDLMSQLLDGQLTDLEVGAFALAMRIKGESTAELSGFLRATVERCQPLGRELEPGRPVVVLPSYNGSRKLPNLTALLALLLAQEGVPVLIHGPATDPQRVTTAEVFRDLGLPVADDIDSIRNAWSRHEPVFVRIDWLCAPLQRLLDVRRTVGLRNSGHTLAKLLDPLGPSAALRVVNYTHPEYAQLLSEFLRQTGANAMLLRGTEGEPVADPRRLPRLDVLLGGESNVDLSCAAHEGILTELPVLPRAHDSATTAHYIQSVISGEKPAPPPLIQQAERLRAAVGLLERNGAAREQLA